jgi:radical SAM superfamily enzyme YgiQ (UPF0313 family)
VKVLLFNSCFISKRKDQIEITTPHIRIGISSIASYLREKGIDVHLLDPEIDKLNLQNIKSIILYYSFDMVGLPAYTEEISDASIIAAAVKDANPRIITVVGGPHVSALPEETLTEFSSFDVGVIGEGEQAFLELAEGKEIKDVNGIVYRAGNNIVRNPPGKLISSLDKLPLPAWDLYDIKKYGDTLPIEPLRGCPFSCVFCFRTLGRKVRYKSPERIADEIESNVGKYGIRSFQFLAGTFPISKQHAIAVFDEIIKRDLKIKWGSSVRVDTVNEELLIKMKEASCERLQFGVESGDPDLLNLCGKGTKLEDIKSIFKVCSDIGIKAGMNFILGLPYESEESISRTIRFASELREHSSSANFAILVPFPGTKVYDMAIRNEAGLELCTRDWVNYGKQAGLALRHQYFPGTRLNRIQTKLYFSYYIQKNPLKLIKYFSWKRIIQLIKGYL